MNRAALVLLSFTLFVPLGAADFSFSSSSDTCTFLYRPIVLPSCSASVAQSGWVAPTAECFEDEVDLLFGSVVFHYCEVRAYVLGRSNGDPNPHDDDGRLHVGAVFTYTHSVAPQVDDFGRFVVIGCFTQAGPGPAECLFDGVLRIDLELFSGGCSSFGIFTSIVSRGASTATEEPFRVCVDDLDNPWTATVVRA